MTFWSLTEAKKLIYGTDLFSITQIFVAFYEDFAQLMFVGILWGVTNPLIKIGSKGLDKVAHKTKNRKNGFFGKLLTEFKFLLFNWKYMLPFLINQSGSVVFYFTLQNSDLSVVVPVTNSITFISTAFTGWLIGEEIPNKRTFLGMLLILAGISCYLLDKS